VRDLSITLPFNYAALNPLLHRRPVTSSRPVLLRSSGARSRTSANSRHRPKHGPARRAVALRSLQQRCTTRANASSVS